MGTEAERKSTSVAARVALGALILLLSGCSSILFVRTPLQRTFTEPSYEVSKPFFFFGLVGPDQHVFIEQVCLKKAADQVLVEYTGADFLNSLLTLGIYSPRSVKVWCQL